MAGALTSKTVELAQPPRIASYSVDASSPLDALDTVDTRRVDVIRQQRRFLGQI